MKVCVIVKLCHYDVVVVWCVCVWGGVYYESMYRVGGMKVYVIAKLSVIKMWWWWCGGGGGYMYERMYRRG